MKCDLLLKNGHIMNPKRGIDYVGDLAVKDGKIISAQNIDGAKKTVDVKGKMVVPGLIDIHTHINFRGGYTSMPVDPISIPTGVTASVDAGSTGVSNCPSLFHALHGSITKTKIMLNVAACGIIMASQFAEPLDPSIWDIGLFDDIFARYGQQIIGLKLRLSRSVAGKLELEPLKKAVELAGRYGTRVIVHTTNPPESLGALADILRSGDVLTHMYQGAGSTCIENGKVIDQYWAARERGVLFDAAPGQGNFSLPIAKQAIKEGFLPDSISTDLNINNMYHPYVYNMPAVMSKFLALGMKVDDVIDCATEGPAVQWGGEGQLGCLVEGTPADITVLDLKEASPLFQDKYGNQVRGSQIFVPEMTVIDGKVWYQSMELHPGV